MLMRFAEFILSKENLSCDEFKTIGAKVSAFINNLPLAASYIEQPSIRLLFSLVAILGHLRPHAFCSDLTNTLVSDF